MGVGKWFSKLDCTSRRMSLRRLLAAVLEPPAKPAAKTAAKSGARPSATSAAKPAAKVAAKPAPKLAAGEPIPVAPVEDVQLFESGQNVEEIQTTFCSNLAPPENFSKRRWVDFVFTLCVKTQNAQNFMGTSNMHEKQEKTF